MERERRIFCRLLKAITYIASFSVSGCVDNTDTELHQARTFMTSVEINCSGLRTRSSDTFEDRINDINLLIFRSGETEDQFWREYDTNDGNISFNIELVQGETYSFYALANFGTRITVREEKDMSGLIYKTEYPEEMAERGIPMAAVSKEITATDGEEVKLELTRLAAKISLRMDRSRMTAGTDIRIQRVSVGNSPCNSSVFEDNRIISRYDRFEKGWTLTDDECSGLNNTGRGGKSEEVVLYMLENLQGDFPHTISGDDEKVFEEGDNRTEVCSYIELELTYLSQEHYSSGSNLIYRFYLGGSRRDLDIERNCHYHILVSPEDNGLKGDGWRVDKSGIGTYIQEIILSETTVDMTYKGEEHQLEALLFPEEATDRKLLWKSSDNQVADVDDNGMLKAASEGNCVIRCMASDGSGATAECRVNVKYGQPSFKMYPAEYIEGRVGEKIHIWCEFFPPNAEFDPGYEELNYDRRRGIYDYQIDEDGKGVVLTLRNPGTGIVLMTVGEPVNQSGMSIVVVKD